MSPPNGPRWGPVRPRPTWQVGNPRGGAGPQNRAHGQRRTTPAGASALDTHDVVVPAPPQPTRLAPTRVPAWTKRVPGETKPRAHVLSMPSVPIVFDADPQWTQEVQRHRSTMLALDEGNLVDVMSALHSEQPGPILPIASLADLRRALYRTELGEDALISGDGPLADMFWGDTPATLVFLYQGASGKGLSPVEAETLNELFDMPPRFNGRVINPNLRIIGLVETSQLAADAFTDAFCSRFKGFCKPATQPAPELEQCARITPEALQPQDHVIDLFGAPHWHKILFGHIERRGHEAPVFHPGEMQCAQRLGAERIVFKNPPDDPIFEVVIAELRRGQAIDCFGQDFTLSSDTALAFLEEPEAVSWPRKLQRETLQPDTEVFATVNSSNVADLFSRLRFSEGVPHNLPGLLDEMPDRACLLIEDQLSDWQWRQLVHALRDKDCRIAFAAHIAPPAFVQNVPDAPASPLVEPVAFLGCHPGESMRITASDVELCVSALRARDARTLVFDVTPKTRVSDLLQGIHFEGEGSERRGVIDDAPFLKALQGDAPVVLIGLESNPRLRAALAPLFQKPPRLMVNGDWVELKAPLMWPTPELPTQAQSVCRNQATWLQDSNAYEEALCEALQMRHPKLGITPKHVTSLLHVLRDLRQWSADAAAPITAPIEPDFITLDGIFSAAQWLCDNAALGDDKHDALIEAADSVLGKAIADTRLGNFVGNAEQRAFLKVRLRMALYHDKTCSADVEGLKKLLLSGRPSDVPTWQLARLFSTDVLRALRGQKAPPSFNDRAFARDVRNLAVHTVLAADSDLELRHILMQRHPLGDAPEVIPKPGRHAHIDPLIKHERRTAKYIAALKTQGCLYLKGGQGAGKTHLATTTLAMAFAESQNANVIERTVGPMTTVNDLMPIFEALAAPAVDGQHTVVVLNEANLVEPGVWRILEGFFRGDTWQVGNKTLKIHDRDRKKIIFTANDETQPGRAFQPTLLARVPTAYVDALDPLLLLHRMAEPALAQRFKKPTLERLASGVVDLYVRFQNLPWAADYSPRTMQEVMRRMVLCDERPKNPWDERRLLAQAFWDVVNCGLSAPQRDALEGFLEIHLGVEGLRVVSQSHQKQRDLAFEPRDAEDHAFILTQATEHYAAALQGAFDAREAEVERGQTMPGQRSLLVEGPPGVGKDDLPQRFLQSAGYVHVVHKEDVPSNKKGYVITNAGGDFTALKATIRLAQNQGLVCIIQELNLLPSDVLEGELNDILTGDAQPGFLLIGTTNPAAFEGREVLSGPFRSRATPVRIDRLRKDDFLRIIHGVGGSKARENAEILVDYHQEVNNALAQAGMRLAATPRELLRAVERLDAGEPLRTVLQSIYARYITAAVGEGRSLGKSGRDETQPTLPHLQTLAHLLLGPSVNVAYGRNIAPVGTFSSQENTLLIDEASSFVEQRTQLLLQCAALQVGIPLDGHQPSALQPVTLLLLERLLPGTSGPWATVLANSIHEMTHAPDWQNLVSVSDPGGNPQAYAGELLSALSQLDGQARAEAFASIEKFVEDNALVAPDDLNLCVLRRVLNVREHFGVFDGVPHPQACQEALAALSSVLNGLPTTALAEIISVVDFTEDTPSRPLRPTLLSYTPSPARSGPGPGARRPGGSRSPVGAAVGSGLHDSRSHDGVWGVWQPVDGSTEGYLPAQRHAFKDLLGALNTRQAPIPETRLGKKLGRMELAHPEILDLNGKGLVYLPVPDGCLPQNIQFGSTRFPNSQIQRLMDGRWVLPIAEDVQVSLRYDVYQDAGSTADAPTQGDLVFKNRILNIHLWPELEAYVKTLRLSGDPPRILAENLCQWIKRNGLYSQSEATRRAHRQLENSMGPLDRTLSVQAGVCQEFALLFAALAQNMGLPARVVSGHRVNGNQVSATGHAWVEVWIAPAGWTRFDPTPSRLDAETAALSRGDPFLDAIQSRASAATPEASRVADTAYLEHPPSSRPCEPAVVAWAQKLIPHIPSACPELYRKALRVESQLTEEPTGEIDQALFQAGDPCCFIDRGLGARAIPKTLLVSVRDLEHRWRPSALCMALMECGFEVVLYSPRSWDVVRCKRPEHLGNAVFTLLRPGIRREGPHPLLGEPHTVLIDDVGALYNSVTQRLGPLRGQPPVSRFPALAHPEFLLNVTNEGDITALGLQGTNSHVEVLYSGLRAELAVNNDLLTAKGQRGIRCISRNYRRFMLVNPGIQGGWQPPSVLSGVRAWKTPSGALFATGGEGVVWYGPNGEVWLQERTDRTNMPKRVAAVAPEHVMFRTDEGLEILRNDMEKTLVSSNTPERVIAAGMGEGFIWASHTGIESWQPGAMQPTHLCDVDSTEVLALAACANRFAILYANGDLEIRTTSDGSLETRLACDGAFERLRRASMAFSPDGKRFVVDMDSLESWNLG